MQNLRHHWELNPDTIQLNHGSFGACPKAVLIEQLRLRKHLEADPVNFMVEERPKLWTDALSMTAEFMACDPDGMAFVTNATTAVNAVLRSIQLEPDDEILCLNHEYNACRNVLAFAAEQSGAKLKVLELPFPNPNFEEMSQKLLAAVTPKTRLVFLDHVTSQTALVLPVAEWTRSLKEKGVLVMIDGAHAAGMLDFSIAEIGADFYTSNTHKWICAPKGSAFLWVAADHRDWVRPAVISHGANAPTASQTRFRWEFDWQGTYDPTPWLCIPAAIDFMGSLFPGGWAELSQKNHDLVIQGRDLILETLGTEAPCADDAIGSMATIPIGVDDDEIAKDHFDVLPLQRVLYDKYRIQVPMSHFPSAPTRWLRISAQAYNRLEDYQALASALKTELGL